MGRSKHRSLPQEKQEAKQQQVPKRNGSRRKRGKRTARSENYGLKKKKKAATSMPLEKQMTQVKEDGSAVSDSLQPEPAEKDARVVESASGYKAAVKKPVNDEVKATGTRNNHLKGKQPGRKTAALYTPPQKREAKSVAVPKQSGPPKGAPSMPLAMRMSDRKANKAAAAVSTKTALAIGPASKAKGICKMMAHGEVDGSQYGRFNSTEEYAEFLAWKVQVLRGQLDDAQRRLVCEGADEHGRAGRNRQEKAMMTVQGNGFQPAATFKASWWRVEEKMVGFLSSTTASTGTSSTETDPPAGSYRPQRQEHLVEKPMPAPTAATKPEPDAIIRKKPASDPTTTKTKPRLSREGEKERQPTATEQGEKATTSPTTTGPPPLFPQTALKKLYHQMESMNQSLFHNQLLAHERVFTARRKADEALDRGKNKVRRE
ncbi:hypothetical protein XA68_17979 [Ophiocordyceps unilateralis]|uniref:Uncharacterized protein n=1 Tax=Ophiocordyceps unilateralis TaxID=268505 RepID=A0A2A9P2D9_OPHUN|nr:hypothetical protein XA68_17979 [Ophiocordyceps unilateralis]